MQCKHNPITFFCCKRIRVSTILHAEKNDHSLQLITRHDLVMASLQHIDYTQTQAALNCCTLSDWVHARKKSLYIVSRTAQCCSMLRVLYMSKDTIESMRPSISRSCHQGGQLLLLFKCKSTGLEVGRNAAILLLQMLEDCQHGFGWCSGEDLGIKALQLLQRGIMF